MWVKDLTSVVELWITRHFHFSLLSYTSWPNTSHGERKERPCGEEGRRGGVRVYDRPYKTIFYFRYVLTSTTTIPHKSPPLVLHPDLEGLFLVGILLRETTLRPLSVFPSTHRNRPTGSRTTSRATWRGVGSVDDVVQVESKRRRDKWLQMYERGIFIER